jgi:hypothetical protein
MKGRQITTQGRQAGKKEKKAVKEGRTSKEKEGRCIEGRKGVKE